MTLLALWLVTLAWPGWRVMAQAGQTVVRPDPLVFEVGIGQVKTLDIILENATNVYGIDVRGQFDAQAVEVVDADPAKDGVQMLPGSFPAPDFVVINVTENITGTFQYVTTQVNPTPPVSGNGVVLSLQVRGKKISQSDLTITFVQIADRYGNNIPVTPQNGTIKVISTGNLPTPTLTASPVPSATSTPQNTFTNPVLTATRAALAFPSSTSVAMPNINNPTPAATLTLTVASFATQVTTSATSTAMITAALIETTQAPPTALTLTGRMESTTPYLTSTSTTHLKKATFSATVLALNAVTQTQMSPTRTASRNVFITTSIIGVVILIGLISILLGFVVVFIIMKRRQSKINAS